MELWFNEMHTKHVKIGISVKEQIVNIESPFQNISVLETYEFGKVLTIDGYIQLTEKDEFIYHEMMVHVPLAVNPSISNVLVIGGGDGGCVRELCKYDTIKNIDLCEIDKKVVEICKEHLPTVSCALDDPRVTVYFEDGMKFARGKTDCYDLIIVDSTDPFGPGEGLFSKEFYACCHKALTKNGILINQHESVYYDSYKAEVRKMHGKISSVFEKTNIYQVHIPTYPSGHWLLGFASKGSCPLEFNEAAWQALNIETNYYNTLTHKGAFYLPNNVMRELQ